MHGNSAPVIHAWADPSPTVAAISVNMHDEAVTSVSAPSDTSGRCLSYKSADLYGVYAAAAAAVIYLSLH
jgi:hypothetical protein